MSLKSFILQSLFVLLFCTSFLSATDPFGLRISEYRKVKAYVGVRHYGFPITEPLLISEAKKVWDFLPQTGGPGMVSALSTGDGNIYFATSIIGTSRDGDMGFPPLITSALDACRQQQEGQGSHVFSGRCGELMAIAEWYIQHGGGHPDSHVQLPVSGKLIVAVDHQRKVRQPCSWEDNLDHHYAYGCADVLPKLGFSPGEIVKTDPTEDPNACHVGPRGLTERACVPKKATKPRGKGKPKRPSNNRPKSASPKKPRARSNKRPKH